MVLRALFVTTTILSLVAPPAAAQTRGKSVLRTEDAVSSARPVRSAVDGAVRYDFTQYATPSEEDSKLNQSQLTQVDLKADAVGDRFRWRVDFSAGKYLDLNNSFYSVQELYVSWRAMTLPKGEVTLSAGRKLEFWSDVDQNWDLGLWEPKFNIDSLRPVRQGLTGAFLKARADKIEFLAYASPVFVPTINPDIQEKNGDLRSESRWFKSASSGPVLDRETRYVYSISMPELYKLVGNPGQGARLRYGGQGLGPWASLNYARKPVNSLFIQYDANLSTQSQREQAEIVVSPSVSYHNLYGADAGWIFTDSKLSASFLTDETETDRPQNEFLESSGRPSNWVRQMPGRLKIYAFHADTRLQTPVLSEPVGIAFDYMKVDEVLTIDVDADGKEQSRTFAYRLNYTNAASISTDLPGRLGGRPFLTRFKYLRDFDQNGSVWSLIGESQITPAWALTAGVDLLGVDDGSDSNLDERFLNQFRSNDRVFGGLSYVF